MSINPTAGPQYALGRAVLLAFLFVCFLSLVTTAVAQPPDGVASSSVRGPGDTNRIEVLTPGSVPGNVSGGKSDAAFWRDVRNGEAFRLGGSGVGTPILIGSNGEEWRAVRNGIVHKYGGWLILATLVVIALYFLIRGQVQIEGGRRGRFIPRFSEVERMIHWFVASTFILLAVSGLVLMFGRYVFPPVIGPSAFGVIASACLQAHNLFGPMFIFGLVFMFIVYVKDNIPKWVDVLWLLKGGVFFVGHCSSWKYNMGEKIWFWIAILAGAVLSVSGVLLDFPMLSDDVDWLRLAAIAHGAAAVLVIAPALAHIYLGTVGVEGALEGMTAGKVDENWAIEHHDLWAKEVIEGGEAQENASLTRATGRKGRAKA